MHTNGQQHEPKAESNGTGPVRSPGAQPIASPLRRTLELLWGGRWLLFTVVVLTVGAVAAYVYQQEPVYEASSLVSVELLGNPGLRDLGLSIEQELGLGFRTGANELWELQFSTDVAEDVASRLLDLETLPNSREPMSVLLDEDGRGLSQHQVAARLSAHITFARAEENVDAIRMTASSTIPGEAAVIANLYAQAYIRHSQESSRARIIASREFLEEQERNVQEELVLLEEQIKNYVSTEGALALDEEASLTVNQISQLEAVRDEARIEMEMQEATFNSLEAELAEIEPRLVRRVASGVEEELERLQASIAELELRVQQIYGVRPELRARPDSDQELRDLNQRITQLRDRADRLSRQYVDEMLSVGGIDPSAEGGAGLSYVAQKRRELAEARIAISGQEAKIRLVNQRLRDYQYKLREIPSQSMRLAQLERARKSAEQLYVFILERLQEVRIAEQSELGYAEIVRPAATPLEPVRPNKVRSMILGFVAGLMLGGGVVLLRDHLDTRIHAPEDLEEMGFSVLGVIPIVHAHGGRHKHSGEAKRRDRRKQSNIRRSHGVKVSENLAAVLNPVSPAAESYRRLRANIQFSRPDTRLQTILVTSAEAGEGKSTTAVNLAVAMAQSSRRTVVVDADLRRPVQHRMLGLSREPGLTDILFNREPYRPERYATPIDDLYLIAAGSKVPNPAELFGSVSLRRLLERLRQEFDVIIFDSPPVLAFSDAMLLATQCDATLLVAETDKTDMRAFHGADQTLTGVGATVIGGVVNKYDPASDRRFGYGYGYRYYHYDYYQTRYYQSESRA